MKRNRIIEVFALPELVPSDHCCDICVAIDVLRATTTITVALQNGAKRVVPFLTVDETFAAKEKRSQTLTEKSFADSNAPSETAKNPDRQPRNDASETTKNPDRQPRNDASDEIILGGERRGVLIEGFDAGNSPSSYSPKFVQDKTLLFTTTNGTKAIHRAIRAVLPSESSSDSDQKSSSQKSGIVLLASFLNAQAVVDRIDAYFEKRSSNLPPDQSDSVCSERISIICAGTCGEFTEEDLLLAGLLVSRLSVYKPEANGDEIVYSANVQAETVREFWRKTAETAFLPNDEETKLIQTPRRLNNAIFSVLLNSRGGNNLQKIQLKKDIRDASQLDSVSTVPVVVDGIVVSFEE